MSTTQVPDAEQLLSELIAQTRKKLNSWQIDSPLIVGIHSGGAWIAQALHDALDVPQPLGLLDISFYRDDFTRIGMNPKVKPTELPVAIDDQHILLVDDVLHTGRTIRAALNVLFEYGRPASVHLAVLVERPGRELPICPDMVSARMDLEPNQHVKLDGPSPLKLSLVTQDA